MAKGRKGIKGRPQTKKSQVKGKTKGICGCGCIPLVKTK